MLSSYQVAEGFRQYPPPHGFLLVATQLGLQLQVGQDVSAVKDSLNSAKEEMKNGFQSVKEEMHFYQASGTVCASRR